MEVETKEVAEIVGADERRVRSGQTGARRSLVRLHDGEMDPNIGVAEPADGMFDELTLTLKMAESGWWPVAPAKGQVADRGWFLPCHGDKHNDSFADQKHANASLAAVGLHQIGIKKSGERSQRWPWGKGYWPQLFIESTS